MGCDQGGQCGKAPRRQCRPQVAAPSGLTGGGGGRGLRKKEDGGLVEANVKEEDTDVEEEPIPRRRCRM
jgi:hypothetical protein